MLLAAMPEFPAWSVDERRDGASADTEAAWLLQLSLGREDPEQEDGAVVCDGVCMEPRVCFHVSVLTCRFSANRG